MSPRAQLVIIVVSYGDAIKASCTRYCCSSDGAKLLFIAISCCDTRHYLPARLYIVLFAAQFSQIFPALSFTLVYRRVL